MQKLIDQFLDLIRQGSVEVYNEFSLQHELGIFLRSSAVLPGRNIQFERNVRFFKNNKRLKWTKKEIDISIFSNPAAPDKAIELKYPRNGQYPETMFSFCKDIRFLEELKAQAGFKAACLLVLADDPLLYAAGSIAGIYGHFRAGVPLQGKIPKPTGKSNKFVALNGCYKVQWHPIRNPLRYFYLEV